MDGNDNWADDNVLDSDPVPFSVNCWCLVDGRWRAHRGVQRQCCPDGAGQTSVDTAAEGGVCDALR